MSESEWGYAVYDDGTTAPLEAPEFSIPEEDRQYLIQSPGLTLWTKKHQPETDIEDETK